MKYCHYLYLLMLGLVISSCEKEENIRIPFGYDPSFNYLALLKSSPGYDSKPAGGLPAFTYQDKTDENLIQLRSLYKLDSIAGTGDELERILNLFYWVHQEISHDGNHAAPEPENSLNILNYCEETGNGVNCVHMAIVLNEVCLSMGFKSRVIQGNAKKFIFNGDWHAFNTVYSNSLGKWIFLDPMKLGYYMDENGELLSITGIRARMINGKALVLNPDADYNGNAFDENEYLNYLAKNFYRFSCSVHSAFGNYEMFYLKDPTERVYIHLDPSGQKQAGLKIGENYFTSNTDFYWANPE